MSLSSIQTKPCTLCGRELPLDRFCADNRARLHGKQSQCKDCQNEYRKQRYQDDPVYRARVNAKNKRNYKPGTAQALSARRRDERVAIAAEAKARPCVDCGNQYPPPAMDFDHVRGTKVAAIAKLVHSDAPLSVLYAELEKCEVRCAVCHRLRHHTLDRSDAAK